MKIRELTEALPGQVSGARRLLGKIGLGGAAARGEKIMRGQAKAAFKQWLSFVPRLTAGGTNMNDKATYARIFGQYMSKALKLAQDDPIVTGAIDQISRTRLDQIDNRYMTDLIFKMMGQQRSKVFSPQAALVAPGLPQTAPAKSIPKPRAGSKRKMDGNEYILVRLKTGGYEWHDSGGNRAPDKIQRKMKKQYGI